MKVPVQRKFLCRCNICVWSGALLVAAIFLAAVSVVFFDSWSTGCQDRAVRETTPPKIVQSN